MADTDVIILDQISSKLNISKKQIKVVLQLLDEGNTVPFIARYRKEVTGALDEEQIRNIHKEWEYRQNLAQRKEDVVRLIDEKGMLTSELRDEINKADKLSEVEDLYRPYKEKKKTRATNAINKGLEPLANWILTFPVEGDVEDEAGKYISNEEGKEVKSIKEAIQGAMDIIAEKVSDSAEYRKWIRTFTFKNGIIVTKVKDVEKDERNVYEMYYEYEEAVRSIRPHRVLAVNRGESEKVLRVSISISSQEIIDHIEEDFIKNKKSIVNIVIKDSIKDAYKRLIKPSIDREIRSELKEKAEEQAIYIFSENLRNRLLQPPMKDKMVLGVDPAFRTGCKLAVVDDMGKVIDIDVIYPHEKFKGEKVSTERRKKAQETLISKINSYPIQIIAIGNGTASRETEQFVANTIKEIKSDINYVIVNEAGASVYSASDLARKEFPELHVEERSAISIARRLQDPLAELVKIDPKSIGVGQYQHDVTQSRLSDSLNFIVETAVNKVGVNVNTSSSALLSYVSGCSKAVANNIVKFREKNGRFHNRENLKDVPRFGDKVYEQAIGFLRIVDGEKPLDKTPIHPESYEAASLILNKLGFTSSDLGNEELKEAINKSDRKQLMNITGLGEHTLNDILDAFIAPMRDPRDNFDAPILRKDVMKLEDLQPGMELQGTVRNVVDFGAFVDCGVKEDGLVHISKMSNNYIKHPLDVVSVGEVITVWVHSVDIQKGRLALTMKTPI